MDAASYNSFTEKLLTSVRENPDIEGIVFAGSTAASGRRDNWSDHDFLLIVKSGEQERFRQNLSWLPDADQIIYRMRETEHGLNIIYSYGHLIEFAVFDLVEMTSMKANDYSVPVDKADIAERMLTVIDNSQSSPLDIIEAVGHAIQLIFAGSGRYARGEKLSAHIFIRSYALRRVLQVLPAILAPTESARLDSLDPYRRFEQVLPEIAAEIDALNRLDALETGAGYIDLLEKYVRPHVANYPDALQTVVRARIAQIREG